MYPYLTVDCLRLQSEFTFERSPAAEGADPASQSTLSSKCMRTLARGSPSNGHQGDMPRVHFVNAPSQ